MQVEHMKCPLDGSDLVIADRQGVEIDYCPRCRGVWLDRGELDKIIERAAVLEASRAPQPAPQAAAPPLPHPAYSQPGNMGAPRNRERDDDDDRHRQRDSDDYNRKRKKKSFLSEIFDFD